MTLLASSYYTLYSPSKQSTPPNTKINCSSSNTSTSRALDNDESSTTIESRPQSQPQQFWQEFEFTNEEKEQIQTILNQNQHKCSILENSVTKQRGQFIIDKYEKEAMNHWDNFYASHETKFFKDRHYLYKAFPNEFGIVYSSHLDRFGDDGNDGNDGDNGNDGNDNSESEMKNTNIHGLNNHGEKDVIDTDEIFTITEIGCGVGNTVLPLLELDPYVEEPMQTENTEKNVNKRYIQYKKKKMFVWGLDFSSVAINLLRKDERYTNATTINNDRTRAQVWDITSTHPNQISADIMHGKVHQNEYQPSPQRYHMSLESSSNISLLLFVLSAVSPDKMHQAAKHVASTLKPGGVLVFRDYGRYDEAQIKLATSRNKCLSDNFYVKHDGTRCYYFTLEDVQSLFGSGIEEGQREESMSEGAGAGAGLEVLELKYVQRVYKNRSDDATRKRVWVQARFRKPI